MTKFISLLEKVENNSVIRSIRAGLVTVIPVLIVGSFSLVLKSLPINIYQQFIADFMDGILLKLFNTIYYATFGMLSAYTTVAVSVSYSKQHTNKSSHLFGMPLTAIACFYILTSLSDGKYVQSIFGDGGMLAAIFSSVVSSAMYLDISDRANGKLDFFVDRVDLEFNSAVAIMIPFVAVVSIFGIINILILSVFGISGFYELTIQNISKLLVGLGVSFSGGFMFVFASSILWVFGINGIDIFPHAIKQLFISGTQINAMVAGDASHQILTNEFFSIFVHIGGRGSTLCLLVAFFLFGALKGNKNFGKMAAIPMIFNINELIVFGLPIVFNPILFIPFILTPVILYLITYTAMAVGIVPLTIHTVSWTTPIIFGGYFATGSVRGSLLQVFNLVVGICIYGPFVKFYERGKINSAANTIVELVNTVKESELSGQSIILTKLMDDRGIIAKMLAADLKYAIETEELMLHY